MPIDLPYGANRSLRFCMVTTFYPPYNFGGDGICVYRLSNELAARGHSVEVIHCADAYHALEPREPTANAPQHPNVTVHRLKSGFGLLSPLATQQTGYPFFKAAKIRRILEKGAFDVIHYHNISLVGGPKILGFGTAPVKLYTMHEHWLVCPMHVLWKFDREVCAEKDCLRCQLAARKPPQWWRYSGMLPREIRHVDAFISPSRFTQKVHQEQLSPDLPIVHIPHFLPPIGESAEEIGAAGAENRPRNTRPFFLFVGRLEKIKGVQTLIRAFRRYDKADLLIAGDGLYRAELEAMAADVPHIRFLGRLALPELRDLYRDSLAAIAPSLCVETFGMIVLEAFAMGTPVIVNDLGALPEMVEDSDGGFIYRTDDELLAAMETLQTHPAERERRGQNAFQTYQRLGTPDAHLKRYFTLIQEIAARKENVPA